MSTQNKQFWLFKSEPSTFSLSDLKAAPDQSTLWDGVRNYQARNFMRDAMQVGDEGFFYHSSCPHPGIVGQVRIVSEALPDPTALDPKSPYFDPKATPEHNPWVVRRVVFLCAFKELIPLAQLRACNELIQMPLLARGNRLSITPVTFQEWNTIVTFQEHA